MKVAVITPYFKEARDQLERCLSSVKCQTYKADHFLISDGHPQDWIDSEDVRHIRLGKSHNDYGNTPRGIGAQLAVSEDYDAIAFLDADNWYDKDHVDLCLREYRSNQNVDIIFAKRRLIRPDLSIMNINESDDFVDTNCYFFLRGSFFLLHRWNIMPKYLSCIGDRIFYHNVIANNLSVTRCSSQTVNYYNLWKSTYLFLGEDPPDGSKENVDSGTSFEIHRGLSSRERLINERLIGFSFKFD